MVDESRDGKQIAREIISARFGAATAEAILGDFSGHQFPLQVVQSGHLSRLAELAEKESFKNAELREIILLLVDSESSGEPKTIADRILDFCTKFNELGRSPKDTFFKARDHFSDPGELGLVTAEEHGDIIQFRLRSGEFIAYDPASRQWTKRATSMFPNC